MYTDDHLGLLGLRAGERVRDLEVDLLDDDEHDGSQRARPREHLCGNQPGCRVHDNSSLSHFSVMTRPRWLRRAVMNRH